MILYSHLLFISVDDTIYAIGGYDGACHMSSVEKFDPTVSCNLDVLLYNTMQQLQNYVNLVSQIVPYCL